eukprot:comp21073_c0_seq1/m.44384 comp21073_c0_seq1/g.44384  ORF comp21073_c0_seq1/g.44384 comp21073_c0_seq1/m.44384 type:complete len:387 (+) comp21073_c0_seq1:192-1352(+)
MMMRGVWVIGGVVLVGVCVAVVAALQIGSAKTARKKRRFPWDETVELSQTVEMLRVFLDRAAHRFSSEQMGNLTALLMKCTQPSGRESNTALEIAIIEVVKQCVTDAMPEYDGADHIENPAEPIASTPATRRGAADPSAERALLGTAARFDFDPEWLDFLHSHGFARIAKIVPQILMTHALTRFDNLCAGRALCPPGFRILRRAADQQTQETHENLENHQKVENQLHIAKFASACGLASDPHFAEIFKHIPRPPLATSVLGSRYSPLFFSPPLLSDQFCTVCSNFPHVQCDFKNEIENLLTQAPCRARWLAARSVVVQHGAACCADPGPLAAAVDRGPRPGAAARRDLVSARRRRRACAQAPAVPLPHPAGERGVSRDRDGGRRVV